MASYWRKQKRKVIWEIRNKGKSGNYLQRSVLDEQKSGRIPNQSRMEYKVGMVSLEIKNLQVKYTIPLVYATNGLIVYILANL